ncbi:MAG: hypothetical protein HQK96_08050 [Nitrospirae bacterium]|nr:hypothetical protein [Nitrospirota bacterium]
MSCELDEDTFIPESVEDEASGISKEPMKAGSSVLAEFFTSGKMAKEYVS